VDFITNEEITLRNSEPAEGLGDGSFVGLNDLIYAERFTNAEVLEQLAAGAVVTSAQFQTTVFDASVAPRYKRAGLFVGRVKADGAAAIDLSRPIFAMRNLAGQDIDLAPLFAPQNANQALRSKLESDAALDVFLLLETANEFETGSSGLPPQLALVLPFDSSGRSFVSSGGSPFVLSDFNWSIELHFSAQK